MKDKFNLLKKLDSIIDAETKRAQDENDGHTDVATVTERVKQRCRPFLNDLLLLLGQIYLPLRVSRKMKRGVKGFTFRHRKNRTSFEPPQAPQPEQYVFEGMEQFRGYPAQLTYEDKPGHVVFVDSRKSHEDDRQKAAEYLEQLLEWDKQRIRLLKNGNRFAVQLVKTYGDLPLEKLVQRWRQDHEDEASTGSDE